MQGTAMAVALEVERPHRRTRRRGQRGSIFKRGDAWTVVYRTREGKQKWEGGFLKKDLAQARLDEVLGAIRNNRYVEPKDTPFKTFCDSWMESAKATLKPRTWISYQSALKNWITPAFGDRSLSDIRKTDVLDFLYELLKDREISRKFVKNVHILLHRLFEAAIERDLLAANPAHKIKLPEASPVFGAAESIERYVPSPTAVVQTFAKLTPTYQALLATGAVTGARRGELLGLYWEDVDFARGVIHIRRTLQRVPKELLDADSFRDVERVGETGLAIVPPKSEKATRFVDMPSNLAAILKALRQQQNGSASPFVFQTEIGKPVDPDAVCDVLYAAQDAAEVRRFSPHCLRHLYCSVLQERAGASLKFAQDRLGHADAATTAKIYTHVVDDRGREFAEKVESAFPFPCVSLTLAKPQAKAAQS
jgi:integrase